MSRASWAIRIAAMGSIGGMGGMGAWSNTSPDTRAAMGAGAGAGAGAAAGAGGTGGAGGATCAIARKAVSDKPPIAVKVR